MFAEQRHHVAGENAARRQLVAVARLGQERLAGEPLGGALDRLLEREMFEGVERIVVDEDADGPLGRQQVGQLIDHARKRVLRAGAGLGIQSLAIIAIFEYCSPLMAQHRGRTAGEPIATGELQTFKTQFFRALAHPTRIRILEILVRGGRTVQELQDALALEQPAVSQQLAVLRNQGIVTTQKKGLSVRYTLRDPLVGELLDVARRIFNNQLVSTQDLLRELRREGRRG